MNSNFYDDLFTCSMFSVCACVRVRASLSVCLSGVGGVGGKYTPYVFLDPNFSLLFHRKRRKTELRYSYSSTLLYCQNT